jgi:hypothetical protein
MYSLRQKKIKHNKTNKSKANKSKTNKSKTNKSKTNKSKTNKFRKYKKHYGGNFNKEQISHIVMLLRQLDFTNIEIDTLMEDLNRISWIFSQKPQLYNKLISKINNTINGNKTMTQKQIFVLQLIDIISTKYGEKEPLTDYEIDGSDDEA